MVFIIKIFSIFLSAVLSIVALVKLGKKKEHFQIYPDSIKKEFLKETRFMTILNILSVAFIFISFFLIQSNLFFILVLTSMFLSANSLYQLYEEFGDFEDKEEKRK